MCGEFSFHAESASQGSKAEFWGVTALAGQWLAHSELENTVIQAEQTQL